MIQVNEYFNGKVKSFAVNSSEGRKTVGVIEAGEYEFNTTTQETMTIIAGSMSAFLPEYNEWEEFVKGSSFDVPPNSTFKVKVEEDCAYLCEYS